MWLRRVFILGFLVTIAAVAVDAAYADEADDLAKQASKDLRTAERNMMSGKKDQAIEGLIQASQLVEKIRNLAPDHKQLKVLDGKVSKLKRDLERRTGKTIDLEAGTVKGEKTDKTPEAGRKEETKSEGSKLPGGVTHRLRKMDSPLKRVEWVLSEEGSRGTDDYRIKQAEALIDDAKDFLKEITSGYADHAEHPEVKAMEKRIAAAEEMLEQFSQKAAQKAADEEKSAKLRDALSEEWLGKISPYVTGLGQPGHDPERYFMASATADVKELNQQKKIYEEAKKVFEAYQAVDFSAGKTQKLEMAEEELKRALDAFPAALTESIGYVMRGAVSEIDQTTRFLASEKEQKWRKDSKEKPYVLAEDRIDRMRKLLDTAAEAVPADQPDFVSCRKKLDALLKENEERRRVRTERTFMIPDRFQGNETDDLKSKASALVLEKFSKAKILRTTVISEDWKEESVVESTDTTNTAIRHRVTRSVSAQVAAKQEDKVFLYTVHVAKDRRTDGTWGALYGNIMFTDPMLEKNVNK